MKPFFLAQIDGVLVAVAKELVVGVGQKDAAVQLIEENGCSYGLPTTFSQAEKPAAPMPAELHVPRECPGVTEHVLERSLLPQGRNG